MNKANYLKTAGGLSVSADGKREIYPVGSDKYDRGLELIRSGNLNGLYDLLWEDSQKIKIYAKQGFKVVDGVVYVGNDALPTTLGEYLVGLADEGFPCEPILRFWANVNANPSRESAMELFDFLTRYKQPITEDGCFIGYRRVTNDFKDFYTRTIDNSVGAKPYMERSKVNPDRQQGCSTGLHVANWNYAKNEYHSGSGVLIEVKVNPKDVVSVPLECNEQKIRVCTYEVLAVCTEQRSDLLTDSSGVAYVNDNDDFTDEDDYDNDDDYCSDCGLDCYNSCECEDEDDEFDEDLTGCGDEDCVLCYDQTGEPEKATDLVPAVSASNQPAVTVNIENVTFVFPPISTTEV